MKTLVLGDYTITFTPSYISFKSYDTYLKVPATCTIKVFTDSSWNSYNNSFDNYISIKAGSEELMLHCLKNNKQAIQSQYNELISLLESYSEPSILG